MLCSNVGKVSAQLVGFLEKAKAMVGSYYKDDLLERLIAFIPVLGEIRVRGPVGRPRTGGAAYGDAASDAAIPEMTDSQGACPPNGSRGGANHRAWTKSGRKKERGRGAHRPSLRSGPRPVGTRKCRVRPRAEINIRPGADAVPAVG